MTTKAKQKRMDKVFQTMKKMIESEGIENVTLKDVAKKSGVSGATAIRYVGSDFFGFLRRDFPEMAQTVDSRNEVLEAARIIATGNGLLAVTISAVAKQCGKVKHGVAQFFSTPECVMNELVAYLASLHKLNLHTSDDVVILAAAIACRLPATEEIHLPPEQRFEIWEEAGIELNNAELKRRINNFGNVPEHLKDEG